MAITAAEIDLDQVPAGEDFDILVLIERGMTQPDGSVIYYPFDGNEVVSAFMDWKLTPDEEPLFSAIVTPFAGTVENPDGSSTSYVLTDGQYRIYIDRDKTALLQPATIESGVHDLWFDVDATPTTQRLRVAYGRWSRAQSATETFA